jgi:hypothetical protein
MVPMPKTDGANKMRRVIQTRFHMRPSPLSIVNSDCIALSDSVLDDYNLDSVIPPSGSCGPVEHSRGLFPNRRSKRFAFTSLITVWVPRRRPEIPSIRNRRVVSTGLWGFSPWLFSPFLRLLLAVLPLNR